MTIFCTLCDADYSSTNLLYALPCEKCGRQGCSECGCVVPELTVRNEVARPVIVRFRDPVTAETFKQVLEGRNHNAKVAFMLLDTLDLASATIFFSIIVSIIAIFTSWIMAVHAAELTAQVADYRNNTSRCILHASGSSNGSYVSEYLYSHDFYGMIM